MLKQKVNVLREKNNKKYLLCITLLGRILLSWFGTRSEHSFCFMPVAAWLLVHQYYWGRAGRKEKPKSLNLKWKKLEGISWYYTSVFLTVSYTFLRSICVQTYPTELQMSNSRAQNRKPPVLHSLQKQQRATGTSRQWFSPHNIKMTDCLGNMGLKNKGRRVPFGLWFPSLQDIHIAYFPSNKEEGRQQGVFSYMNTWHSYSF